MQLETLTHKPEANPHPTPLLFVHGAWHGAWCWEDHFLPYFAQHGYTSHAVDLRGHGKSEGGDRLRGTSISHYVSDLAQIIGKLERPPVLIGHSLGGLVVQKYLEKHQAPAAVLLASVPPGGVLRIEPQPDLRERGSPPPEVEGLLDARFTRLIGNGWND